MKLKEQLAELYVDPLSCDDDKEPFPTWALDLIEKAYIAAFERAREMAYKKVSDYGTGYGALMDPEHLLELGEEEV